MHVYVNHTHLYNLSPPPCYLTRGVLNDCYSKVMAYIQCLLALIGLVFTMHMYAYAMPTNDTDYSFHIKAIELI